MVAVKVCTFGGCPESSILEGLEYVYNHAAPEDIINMSLGGPADADLDNAVIKAANAGLRFVIAAGNDKAYAGNGSPARVDHPNVWTVSAYRQGDEFAKNFDCGSDCNDGSNYGNPPVDFSGPGEDVPSLRIGGGSGMGFIPNTIGDEDGTSYSAPHIAGLLLAAPSVITTDGYVSNDPDGDPDPIAVVPYLGVSISGPTQLDTGETGTWYANVSDGVPPYSYAWYYKPSGATTWSKVGSNSSYSQGTGNGETDYQLKLEVTDETSRSSIDDHFVVVGTTVEPPCYSLVSASEDSLETTSNDSLETNRIPPPDC